MKITVIEDYFDDVFNGRGFNQRSDRITISKKDYQKLLDIAEKYELLAAEHKRIKSQNDVLLKELDDLKDDGRKFKELEEEKEQYLNSLLRAKADLENYKKVSEREYQRYRNYVMSDMLLKLVSHYDDLNRALSLLELIEGGDSIAKGFKILVNNFEKILSDEGVKPMNCEGEIFDPYKHEAMMVEECSDNNLPENTIMEELDKGYYYKDKVLKPARVKILKKSNLKNENENKKLKGSE